MSALRIEHWDPADGPLTEKRYIAFLEQEGYDVAIFAYRAGTSFPEHEHAAEKCDAVLEGILRITVGGVAYDLEPGDRMYLPAGTRHAAQVVGRRTVISLDGTKY